MIQVYSKRNTNFSNNGDMTVSFNKAVVSAKLNGTWCLDFSHSIDDEGRWKYLEDDAVIKIHSFNGEQLFRIKEIEKSDSGVYGIAFPIFLDARDDVFLTDVRPTNKSGQEALNILLSGNTKYSGESNITKVSTAYYEYANLIESLNGTKDNVFVNRWGGEILYDNYKIIINERVGGDYGVELRYGKNIKANGIKEEIDLTETVTRLYPKAFNGRKLSNIGYVDSPNVGKYSVVKCDTMKFDNIKLAEDSQGDPADTDIICNTQAELDKALTDACNKQFALGLDKPIVTIEADMILLQNTEEYSEYKMLETVSLGDTIHCKHDKLGIVTNARVIELEYDCLLDQVSSVKLGDFKRTYFDDVTENVNKIEGIITPEGNVMADKVVGILNAMNTQLKYQKDVAHKQDVRAILFEDLDKASPTYGAMCLGTQGFQIANKRTADGRGWDWRTAGTANGLSADTVITGTITDKTGKNYWNLDTGDFQLVGAGGSGGSGLTQEEVQGMVNQGTQNAIQESAKALTNYANTVAKDFETMQKQVDGQVEDWYYDYEPFPTNVPANSWGTETARQKHEGDRFFWKSKGYAYRWTKDGTAWKWVLLKDTDITTAMQKASEAKDVADGKRRTFVTRPNPPYDVGDLWMDGKDVLTCMTARPNSGFFSQSDWRKLNTYTDDTVANEALGNSQNPDKFLTQLQVFNKLTNNGQLKGIFMRDGELYINGTHIATGTLADATGKNSWNLETGELKLERFDLKVQDIDEAIRQANILIGQNGQSINSSVERIEREYKEAIKGVSDGISEVSSRVDQTMTADQVRWEINKQFQDGANRVDTQNGMTFDETGLNIDRAGAPTKTNINENGMKVSENGQTVLTANNQGVDARNLHATTYLIIGNNSRLEDYEENYEQYTACFWIGGA